MSVMPWSARLSVGMPAVDHQHHWLVNTLNRLHDELAAHEPDHDEIGQVLEGLMDYTVNHFVAEEVLFERHGYPQAAAHKALHDQFSRRVMQWLSAHESGQVPGSEVVAALTDWLVTHILGADKAYVPFVLRAERQRSLRAHRLVHKGRPRPQALGRRH